MVQDGIKECVLRFAPPPERGQRKRVGKVHGRQSLEA
jgi:hypothetical protein